MCRVYAVQIADSVLVNKAGTAPESLTRFSLSEWADASYEIKDEDDEEEAIIDVDSDVDEDGGGNTRCVPQPPEYPGWKAQTADDEGSAECG